MSDVLIKYYITNHGRHDSSILRPGLWTADRSLHEAALLVPLVWATFTLTGDVLHCSPALITLSKEGRFRAGRFLLIKPPLVRLCPAGFLLTWKCWSTNYTVSLQTRWECWLTCRQGESVGKPAGKVGVLANLQTRLVCWLADSSPGMSRSPSYTCGNRSLLRTKRNSLKELGAGASERTLPSSLPSINMYLTTAMKSQYQVFLAFLWEYETPEVFELAVPKTWPLPMQSLQ